MQLKPIQGAEAPRPFSKPKNLELVDQLRGVAILLVLLWHVFGINFHWVLPWVSGVRDFGAYGYESVFVHLFCLGQAGVPLFFVLSGFCIHWSCMSWERFEIHRFLCQRFWRIYPTYVIALIAVSVVELRGMPPFLAANQFLSHVFLVHNFSQPTFWGINGPFWSLAVEMQLYLLYPLLRAIKHRAGWQGCFLVAGSVSLIWRLVAVAIWGLPDHGVSPAMASPLNTWLDWMLGAWIADCYGSGRRAFPASSMLPFVTLICFVISTIYQPLIIFSFFLASLTSALWLDQMLHREAVVGARSRFPSFLRKAIAWFGLISYSFYLWHEPILIHWHNFIAKFVSRDLPSAIWVPLAVILPVFLATLVAYLSFRLLEKSGIQLGRMLLARLSNLHARRLATASALADGVPPTLPF